MIRIEKVKENNMIKVEKRKKKWSDTGKGQRVLEGIGVALEKGELDIPAAAARGPA